MNEYMMLATAGRYDQHCFGVEIKSLSNSLSISTGARIVSCSSLGGMGDNFLKAISLTFPV